MDTITADVTAERPTASATDRLQLVNEVRDLILESVNLKHRNRDEITERTSLMAPPGETNADSLALDSIDVLEVVVAVEQRYQVKIKDGEDGKRVFRTIGSIADFIANRG